MTSTTLDWTLALTVGGLFATGVHLMLQRSLTRVLLGFILLGHGTNLLLLSAGAEGDPLPQAMALTAIVITFGVTTFLLALAYRSWRLSGHDEVRDDLEDRSIGTVRERDDFEPAAMPDETGDSDEEESEEEDGEGEERDGGREGKGNPG
ncbi:NADH-quinone oxidoreductase subunit K [Streptomyces radicis]|uniref:Sodium:proton antiporter n=1 Tax=Streptomyces radicis TaxID=1750517 RepID=A0A3A9WDU7_9ACTN|nr:NADH-quinone oxidoreductase subunit K [Streptomyces radicis]RKN07574.1 sodium:proton antiporter [Streptomyces radicis]RKN18297.1 sodium:proton antiporter [Streptomyces radicis]